MKTKLSQLWQSLGVNAKTVLIMIGILIALFVMSTLFAIMFTYPLPSIITLLSLLIIKTFQFIKQWLQQNKEN